MKKLLSVNLLFLIFVISLGDDCGVRRMTRAIQLYRDFDAIHTRACHDMKININTYLVLRKKCIKDLIQDFDYDDFSPIIEDFMETDCFKKSKVHTCGDAEYINFRHCAFDFGLEHLEDFLDLYKNQTIMFKVYYFSLEAKECLNKSLDEIEANHQVESMPV